MAAFIPCSPLKKNRDHFRLVKLQPAPTPLQGPVLEIEEYPRADCPAYTALSYAWGAPGDLRGHVTIGNVSYEVSQTVESALRHLATSQPRWLWIDQLCIDQADDDEKSEQVQQMNLIYAEAEQTVAWLGSDDMGIDELFETVTITSEAIEREDYELLRSLYVSDEGDAAEKRERVSEAMEAFCARPYWTRLWVIQEFAVARHVVIMCGEETISWTHFSAILTVDLTSFEEEDEHDKVVDETGHEGCKDGVGWEEDLDAVQTAIDATYDAPALTYVASVFTRRRRWIEYHSADSTVTNTAFQRLLDVVTTSLLLEVDYNVMYASDDRDRLFALLNLANDKDQFPSFPDYSKTTTDVYTEAARLFLQQKHLDLLMCNQFPKLLDSLPSWAPDWSMDLRWPINWQMELREGLAEDNQPVLSFPEPGLLEIQGFCVDLVAEVGPSWDPDWREDMDHDAAAPFVRCIERFCQASQRVPPTDVKHVAGRVAIAGAPAYYLDQVGDGSADTCIRGLEHVLRNGRSQETGGGEICEEEDEEEAGDSTADEISDGISDWYCNVLRLMHSRRPFLTTTGHVGLCSQNAEAGDQLCIFSGSAIPYIMRNRGDERFTLVGEAYVDGGMEGQLFRGIQDVERRSFMLA